MHSITTLTEFQQISQCDYSEALVINHVNVGSEIFHVLEVTIEVHMWTHAQIYS